MLRDQLRRKLIPSTVIAASRLSSPRQLAAQLQAAFGKPIRVELYFAFDDPYAAIAVPGLIDMCAGRAVDLQLYALLERGIQDDPAADARALHALDDATRLGHRLGRPYARQQPLRQQDCAFLAEWFEQSRGAPGMANFAAAALAHLWQHSDAPVLPSSFIDLHRQCLNRLPPITAPEVSARLMRNTRQLRARGHWESPAARIAGEWFFAHERLALIAQRLDHYGATPQAQTRSQGTIA
jgi:2-hydroxychromene-2-carboxylate isomerase